jgi:Ca-activated chloride channel homolog
MACSLCLCCACSFDSMASKGGGGGYTPAPKGELAPPELGDLEIPEGSYWLQLSADDSTSMASAQLARLGWDVALHRHEFLNYYDPAPDLSAHESWGLEGAITESIWLGAKLVMRDDAEGGLIADLLLQLRADPVVPETRRPWHLVYCVDISGSMAGEKLQFVKAALLRSLEHLRQGDRVSLVTFESTAARRLTFEEWPGEKSTIEAAFSSLSATGGTDMSAGLQLAYEIAEQSLDPARLTRVLLFGDGAANVGETAIDRFASLTRSGEEEGIYLSSVGVGHDFDWARMDQLADAGKGASVFLPDADEVERMFGRDFYKLVEVAADEVSIELVLPESMQLVDFSGEETSTDPNARVPSVILASGDDITILARFSMDEPTLAAPLSLRVSMRPLGTGELVVHQASFEAVDELVGPPGPLHARTEIVDDYARHVTSASPSRHDVVAAIDAYPGEDEGLAEIRALLAD